MTMEDLNQDNVLQIDRDLNKFAELQEKFAQAKQSSAPIPDTFHTFRQQAYFNPIDPTLPRPPARIPSEIMLPQHTDVGDIQSISTQAQIHVPQMQILQTNYPTLPKTQLATNDIRGQTLKSIILQDENKRVTFHDQVKIIDTEL